MLVQSQFDLKNIHTFSTPATAKEFVEVTNQTELLEALQCWAEKPYLILGGGSNLLFLNPEVERVLKVGLSGWSVVAETNNHVWIDVAAGVAWHDWVMQSLQQGWYGLENLALIPGNVGAAPMQNIGAYGVEVKEYLDSVQAINRKTLIYQQIQNKDCAFAYRSSAFKTDWKNQFLIASVRFRLAKRNHSVRTDYGAIQEQLFSMGIPAHEAKPMDVARAVMAIRQSKLPDPRELGNAGSFFKNPSVTSRQAQALKLAHPTMPQYDSEEPGMVKLAAGWLIEQSGLKGYRSGDAGVHSKQALVLVNYGKASGKDIWQLSQYVQQQVQTHFGLSLEPEVNAIF
jgi:UDP-N-acetylmuramate dehydrogenase